MTTMPEAIEAIYQRWALSWQVAGEPRTPYCFGKDPFDCPEAPWCRVSVRHDQRSQETLGNIGHRKFQRTGAVMIQYFEPPLLGSLISSQHCDAAERVFNAARIEGTTIRFGTANTRELGIVEDGRWDAALIECNFVYDEHS